MSSIQFEATWPANFFVKTSIFSSPYDMYGSFKNFVSTTVAV